ncbi:hypothetical protein [Puniceibacterium sediminis]|uniref:Uncharacterized protein n=1 Tax=Puniceibacterium sediminis TaxID=1608407 RepID=A0A238YND1_9RHOB|nr:hypothetical protein [Puniceibacterium sediminis]SNR72530.1 hypothetical protein SAMN06265370_11859 [Puniceibacterium sediminis]
MDCILHVGIGKAGSSSIQGVLQAQRDALLKRGILYPRDLLPSGATGGDNNKCLAVSSINQSRPNFVLQQHRVRNAGQRKTFDRKVMEVYSRQVAENGDALCLLSAEHFWSCLPTEPEIARLRTRMANIGLNPVRLIIYIRRQADWFESHQHQRIREGQALLPLTAEGLASTPPALQVHYDRVIAKWEQGFAGTEVVPRLFERSAMRDNDLMTDFCDAAGIEPIHAEVPEKNVSSVSNAGVNALLQLHGWLQARRGAGFENAEWRRLTTHITRIMPGRCAILPDSELGQLDEIYADSNEAVRKRFFSDRPTLFSLRTDTAPKESFSRLDSPEFNELLEAVRTRWEEKEEARRTAG